MYIYICKDTIGRCQKSRSYKNTKLLIHAFSKHMHIIQGYIKTWTSDYILDLFRFCENQDIFNSMLLQHVQTTNIRKSD